MEKPRTTWSGVASRKTKDEPIWAVCTKCGKERFTFATAEGIENYVCPSCRQKEEEPVSMRCWRHKKRFNVPKSWLDKCWWLCPRCYEKLSEEEREKYKPMKMSATHEAEDGKPIIRPSTAIKARFDGICEPHKGGVSETHNVEIVQKTGKPSTKVVAENKEDNHHGASSRSGYKPYDHYKTSSVSSNPSFAELLPRFRIACMKCGEVVPCHYTWFDNSTVLCPSCYGKMTDSEIRKFHQSHHAEKPSYIPNSMPVPNGATVRPIVSTPCNVPSMTETKWTNDSNMVNSGGVWTKSKIMSSSREELLSACRSGKVSKARCRIELRRRENVKYYDMFPEDGVVDPSPFFEG